MVVFGLMGTGKTTLANALGDALGLPVIHSDAVRKSLAGLKPTDRAPEEFGQGIYRADFSDRTYAEMRRLAREHLEAGRSVILDASYKRSQERQQVRELAREGNTRVVFIYLDCPPRVARERLGIRLSDPQATSNGRVELFEAQARDFDPIVLADWPLLRLDSSQELDTVAQEARGFVKSFLPEGDVDAT